MKVILVGATGTIGQAVKAELEQRHDIVSVGFNSGDMHVDITDRDSIEKLYSDVGEFNAVVVTTGKTHFGPVGQMTQAEFQIGLDSKLMGQVNLVLLGLKHIQDGGSFTLTSGLLNRDPIQFGSSAALVNGALDGFVKSAAIELPRGIRINCVSPTVIAESMDKYASYFRGYEPVPAATAALAYSKSVEGLQTGQVFKAGY